MAQDCNQIIAFQHEGTHLILQQQYRKAQLLYLALQLKQLAMSSAYQGTSSIISGQWQLFLSKDEPDSPLRMRCKRQRMAGVSLRIRGKHQTIYMPKIHIPSDRALQNIRASCVTSDQAPDHTAVHPMHTHNREHHGNPEGIYSTNTHHLCLHQSLNHTDLSSSIGL